MTPDDLRHDDLRESRLARLIAATRAEANPAVLARARARIAANEAVPGVAAWLGRPAVLAGAGVLFVLCVAGTFMLGQPAGTTAGETSLLSTIVGEEDLGLPIDTNGAGEPGGAAAGDSGEVRL
jgi:hypothetical protein